MFHAPDLGIVVGNSVLFAVGSVVAIITFALGAGCGSGSSALALSDKVTGSDQGRNVLECLFDFADRVAELRKDNGAGRRLQLPLLLFLLRGSIIIIRSSGSRCIIIIRRRRSSIFIARPTPFKMFEQNLT